MTYCLVSQLLLEKEHKGPVTFLTKDDKKSKARTGESTAHISLYGHLDLPVPRVYTLHVLVYLISLDLPFPKREHNSYHLMCYTHTLVTQIISIHFCLSICMESHIEKKNKNFFSRSNNTINNTLTSVNTVIKLYAKDSALAFMRLSK